MDIFLPVRFRTQVQLSPHALAKGNMDELIRERLQKSLEGVCSRFGYIRPGSIDIVRRSMGCLMKAHFNGHIRYDVVCKAEVCNPARGMVFKVTVRNKNELGILAEGHIVMDGNRMPVLDVLIPRRSAGITSDIDLDEVNTGDEIHVEVLGKRYQLLDKKISIIARAIKEPQKKRARDRDAEKALMDYEEGGAAQDDLYGGCDEEDGGCSEDGESVSDSEGGDDVSESDGGDDDEDPTGIYGGSDAEEFEGGDDPVGGTIQDDEF